MEGILAVICTITFLALVIMYWKFCKNLSEWLSRMVSSHGETDREGGDNREWELCSLVESHYGVGYEDIDYIEEGVSTREKSKKLKNSGAKKK